MIFKKKTFFLVLLIISLIAVAVIAKLSFDKEQTENIFTETLSKIKKTETNSRGLDFDNDGLLDWEEKLRGTDSRNPDTDGDGTNDGDEVSYGRDPLLAGPNDLVKDEKEVIKVAESKTETTATKDVFQTTKRNVVEQSVSQSVESAPAVKEPIILSVFPKRVRSGDSVTVTGENFTPTGNTIVLGDGPIDARFENLSSADGKTLVFTYKPPEIVTMSEAQIRLLPEDAVAQIENPIKAAGRTLGEVLVQYDGIKNESELISGLQKNGHSIDELYHKFWIIVENSNGGGISDGALLSGLPKFSFGSFSYSDLIEEYLATAKAFFSGLLIPQAEAQMMKGGGITTGIVMICTCNGNVMTFQVDYTGGGSGLYVLSPGFVPSAGSGRIAGFWLGGYQTMGGTCSIYAGLTCISIPGNTPSNPVGYSM